MLRAPASRHHRIEGVRDDEHVFHRIHVRAAQQSHPVAGEVRAPIGNDVHFALQRPARDSMGAAASQGRLAHGYPWQLYVRQKNGPSPTVAPKAKPTARPAQATTMVLSPTQTWRPEQQPALLKAPSRGAHCFSATRL